jgi:hypothetical protein
MAIEAPELVVKQPSERIYVQMDFSNIVRGSNTITNIQSITSEKRGGDPSDLIIDSEVISSDGKAIEFFISGGTEFYTYKIEIIVHTSNMQILEGDGLLEVMD